MEFYNYVYPSTKKVGPKSNQDAFSEYGCVEAVNLEYKDESERFHFTAKKEKSLLHTFDTDIHRVFVPNQAVLPLGKPNDIETLFDKPGIADLCQERCVKNESGKKLVKVVSNVERQIHNLMTDHPDAYHGTALKEYSHLLPYTIAQNCSYEPVEEENMSIRQSKMLLNPSLLDIPRDVLNEHLLEDAILQTQNLDYDAAYTGGCIDYVDIKASKSGSYGLLVYPQGSAMDTIDFQTVNNKALTKETDDFELELGAKIKWKLNGTVFQTCASSPSDRPDLCIFGARTQTRALLASLNKDEINFCSAESSRSQFADCNSVNVCGGFQSTTTISSLDLNPYMAGESVVALYNGSVYTWNSTLTQNVNDKDAAGGLQQLNLSDTDTSSNQWSQVVYAAHPRQIYLAKRSEVNLIDMRLRSPSPTKVLCLPHNVDNEKIMAIYPGSSFYCGSDHENTQHIFQCTVATQYNLLLMDQRYCKVPLLQWSLCMRKPCQHLAGFHMQEENNNISFLVAANQMPQQLHSFQYRMETSTQNPPIATCSARSLESYPTIKRSLSHVPVPRCNNYVQRRLSQPVVGITAYSHENRAVVIQISECGDVIYQPLILTDATQNCDVGCSTTGLSSSLYYSERTKKQERTYQDIYKLWAYDMIFHGKNDPETNRQIVSTKFSAASLASRVKLELMRTKTSQCQICSSVCFLFENTVDSSDPPIVIQELNKPNLDSDHDESAVQNLCQMCCNCFEFSEDMLHAHKTGVHVTSQNSREKLESTHKETECKVQDLHLIKTDNATDLGVVLVSTWDNSYEQLWTKLEEHRLKEEKEGERKAALSVLDMPGDQEVIEADINNFKRAEKQSKTPDKNVDKFDHLSNSLSVPSLPLVRMSNLAKCNKHSIGGAESYPIDTASPRQNNNHLLKQNSPLKLSQKSNRKRKSMIGFT